MNFHPLTRLRRPDTQADPRAHARMRAGHFQDSSGVCRLPQAVFPPAVEEHYAGPDYGQCPPDNCSPVSKKPAFLGETAYPVPPVLAPPRITYFTAIPLYTGTETTGVIELAFS